MESIDEQAIAASIPSRLMAEPGEVGMVRQDRWEEIHRLATERVAVAEIARRLDLDRKTVRRCLRQESWQAYRRVARSDTLLATHAEFLRERAPQVRYSARILFQELRQAHGYAGSYETVKLFVRPLRAEQALKGLTQRRFETPPGAQSQIDWGAGPRVLPHTAGRVARVRAHARLQSAQLLPGVRRRAAEPVPRCARTRLRALRRAHARASLRSPAHGLHGQRRRQGGLERDVQGVRRGAPTAAAGEQDAARGTGDPKKSRGLVRSGDRLDPAEGFEFVRVHQAQHPVVTLCRVLGVSPAATMRGASDRRRRAPRRTRR